MCHFALRSVLTSMALRPWQLMKLGRGLGSKRYFYRLNKATDNLPSHTCILPTERGIYA